MLHVFAVILAAICFGTNGTAQELAGVDASPVAVGGARIVIGGGLLGILVLAVTAVERGRGAAASGTRMRREARSGAGSRERPGSGSRSPALTVALGALGVLAYQPFFFAGTSLSGVALGTVVGVGSGPIFTGVIDSVMRRRLPSARWMLVTALALLGVLLASGLVGGQRASDSANPAGILCSLGAGASYAVYTLAAKRLLDRGWSTVEAMGALFGAAAVPGLPMLLVAGAGWIATPRGLALALWLGVVTVAVGYLVFGWGLQSLTATTTTTLTLAEPLTAALLGLIVLHERLPVASVVGLVVLGVALILLTLPARSPRAVRTA